MEIRIKLPTPYKRVPFALAEIKREGAQRRQVYPRMIERGRLSPAQAKQRIDRLLDVYALVDAIALAIAPLFEDEI